MLISWDQELKYINAKIKDRQAPKKEMKMGKNGSGIICVQPFYFMEFTTSGAVYTCCPAWIKFPIGNIKTKTISEIWNDEKVRYIRRKLYLGEWENICNPVCPRILVYKHDQRLIKYDYLESLDYLTPQIIHEIRSGKEYLESTPSVFNLSNSRFCNLTCLMCDRLSQKDDPQVIEKTAQQVFHHLPAARELTLTGMGDPLARPDTRDLLINFNNQNSELRFNLITNALLFPKYWDQIKHQKFGTLLISIDAPNKETYEKIRIGGLWETLLRSLHLIREHRDKFSSVTINMTVMRENYKEIPEFIDFAESYEFNVSFQRVRGIYGRQNFFEMADDQAIHELKEIISREKTKNRQINIFWGDLLEFDV